jgi:hypothetical protein
MSTLGFRGGPDIILINYIVQITNFEYYSEQEMCNTRRGEVV